MGLNRVRHEPDDFQWTGRIIHDRNPNAERVEFGTPRIFSPSPGVDDASATRVITYKKLSKHPRFKSG